MYIGYLNGIAIQAIDPGQASPLSIWPIESTQRRPRCCCRTGSGSSENGRRCRRSGESDAKWRPSCEVVRKFANLYVVRFRFDN